MREPSFSAQFPQMPRSYSIPSVCSRSIVWFLKKGLVISFVDSARARVAVCRQSRKLAMSVAENMMRNHLRGDSIASCVGILLTQIISEVLFEAWKS